jgi:hypothetical protein
MEGDSIEMLVRVVMLKAGYNSGHPGPYARSRLREAYVRMCNEHAGHPVLVIDQKPETHAIVSGATVMRDWPNSGKVPIEGIAFTVAAATVRHHVASLRPKGVVVVYRELLENGMQNIRSSTLNLSDPERLTPFANDGEALPHPDDV